MQLGIKVKDKITGFAGITTGFVQHISGCNQVLVAPPVDKDGKLMESQWFDVQRLVPVEGEQVVLENAATPGCDRQAPRR